MKILKTEASTGGATVPVIDTPKQRGEQETGAPSFDHYDFIDFLAALFKKANDLLRAKANRTSFGLLDIETNPIEQGFEAETYNLIITSNVIHATKNLGITLASTRKLLWSRKKFILFEMSISLRLPHWPYIRDLTRRWLRQVLRE